MDDDCNADDLTVVPLGDCLDLHTFAPADVGEVVEEYLFQSARKGLSEVRLIHGKGKGQLRGTIRALLSRNSHVLRFSDAPPEAGGWGATCVQLKPVTAFKQD